MTLLEFELSLSAPFPASDLSRPLKALWMEANGNWTSAHEIVQDDEGAEAAWIHAYLHRAEGDRSNAAYWYNRANQPFFNGSIADEWKHIVSMLLARD